jgi:KUP system potassium uptake protein
VAGQGVDLDPKKTTFFLGKETILPSEVTGMAGWRERLFSILSNNSHSATAFFRLPVDQVVEIRGQVKI